MRKLVVAEFITLDGVIQAPGGEDEDRDHGFTHGGWTRPYWHDDIGRSFLSLMPEVDALLLGRRTYVTHAEAFEPMAPGDPFGDAMNAPAKYVVSKTLEKPFGATPRSASSLSIARPPNWNACTRICSDSVSSRDGSVWKPCCTRPPRSK